MSLFPNSIDPERNLLPQDGIVHYYGPIFSPEVSVQFYQQLMEDIAWEADKAIIMGKEITTKRKVAWYAEEPFSYTYSRVTKTALPFTPLLREIKEKAEQVSEETFNACLLNLYHNGDEGMAWHSDGEKDLKKNGAIASISFGADRKFSFKHKTSKEKVDIWLENGSLLIMKDTTQSYWLHRLPPTKKVHHPRINLTFRTIINQSI